MILSASSRAELNWWIFNVDISHKLISHDEPKLHIQTDASTHGWGGVRGEQRTGGRWNQKDVTKVKVKQANNYSKLYLFRGHRARCSHE